MNVHSKDNNSTLGKWPFKVSSEKDDPHNCELHCDFFYCMKSGRQSSLVNGGDI